MVEDEKVDTDVVRGRQFVLRHLDDHLHYTWVDGATACLVDAEESLAAVEALAGSRRLPLLVDMRGLKTLDRAARSRFSETDAITRLAFVVESPLSRVLANFFLAVSRPSWPTRMFTSEDEAVAWLTDPT